jgi:hypothetical protein
MSASYLRIAGELVGDAVLDSVVVTQELNHHWWCEVDCRRTEDDRFSVLVFGRGSKQSKPPTATAECDRADELERNLAQFGRKMEDRCSC